MFTEEKINEIRLIRLEQKARESKKVTNGCARKVIT